MTASAFLMTRAHFEVIPETILCSVHAKRWQECHADINDHEHTGEILK